MSKRNNSGKHSWATALTTVIRQGELNVCLLRNLAIPPAACYRQVCNRWEEFYLEPRRMGGYCRDGISGEQHFFLSEQPMPQQRRKHRIKQFAAIAALSLYLILGAANPAQAMHIMEGFLPVQWALFWWVAALPFFILGVRSLTRITRENPDLKLLLALSGAFTFVLSALKIPSVTGSCSHPTGTGLGAVLFGPSVMTVLGSLVLVFQAMLLAHGGLTTLGANAFSMAIVGPWVAYFTYRLCASSGQQKFGIFLAAALGDLATYLVTSVQLALAFPAASGGFLAAFAKFAGIFALTQVPLAISEGLLTVLVWNWLQSYATDELKMLKLLRSHA